MARRNIWDADMANTASSLLKWDSSFSRDDFKDAGDGVVFEGAIKGVTRNTITDSAGKKHRHLVYKVELARAFARQFKDGQEIAVVQNETAKTRTGHLNSSYKTDQVRSDILNAEQVHGLLDGALERLTKARPAQGPIFEFWGDEDWLKDKELVVGKEVRLKTYGNGPFIEQVSAMDTNQRTMVTNFTGESDAGASWANKLVSLGSAALADKSNPTDELEGVDDDEWSD